DASGTDRGKRAGPRRDAAAAGGCHHAGTSRGLGARNHASVGQPVSRSNQGGHAMNSGTPSKVTASHLKRHAYLYVRQSTLRQVLENTESTQRQYALRQ